MANQKIHEYPLERFVYGDDDYYDIDYWDGSVYQTAKILGSTIKAAILSGIAISLTAPDAFIVGGSPVDGTGTLTLTAAGLANQYIRGDGTLATFPASSGGGNNVNYYLNGGTPVTGVAGYYQMSKTAVIGLGVDFSLAGNGLISQWLTDVGDPNILEIPAGAWNFEIFFSASSAGGTPAFYIEVLKYDGTTFTSIADNSIAPEPITSGTATDLYLSSVPMPLTTLLATDRIALRVYIVNSVLGRTITQHTQDSHLNQVITTFSSGISSINGLTKQTQYLAVGTSGTDFNIDSVTDTHTFNLPTASATNRGALSSANWSTFNGKQNAITLTTTGTGAATFVADVLNIPTPSAGGGSGVFGISNSSGVYTYYATLTLAMAAATSGQTIEMFADVIETTNIAITLKDGVNINGNGHTYTLNQAGTANNIQDGGTSVNCVISNITFKRIGGTGSDTNTICMYITGASRLKLKSTNLITASNMRCLVVNNVSAEIFNVYCEGHNPVAQLLSGTIYDSEFRSLGGSGLNVLGTNAKAYKCISYGFYSVGIYMTAGEMTDCIGIGAVNGGIDCYGGSMRNCVGYGGGGPGLTTNNSSVIAIDCVGYGIGGVGISGSSSYMLRCAGYSSVSVGISNVNGILYDCLGYSTVNSGIYSWNVGGSITEVRSCKAISLAAIALFLDNTTSGCKIYNTEAYSKWNNALGHGIKIMGNNAEIVQCVIEVTNASANAINSASAFTTKYANNAFKGSTTPINANITQGMVNIHDSQGNILI